MIACCPVPERVALSEAEVKSKGWLLVSKVIQVIGLLGYWV